MIRLVITLSLLDIHIGWSSISIAVRDGGQGAVDPPIRADTTCIRAKDNKYI